MKITIRLLVFCQAILLVTPAIAVDPWTFWNHYRAKAPLVAQDVIASEISPKGNAVVIVTEPPARIYHKRDQLFKKVFGQHYVAQRLFSYRIGYDGWAKDIVVTLKNLVPETFDALIASLHIEMFGTAYKASYQIFTPQPWDTITFPEQRIGPPNLKINAASLNDWLFKNPLTFLNATVDTEAFGNPSSAPKTLSGLFDANATGVFYSDQPGLLILLIDRSRKLNEIHPWLRQFTLDTDALIGAVVANDNTSNDKLLAIIGRERTTSLSDMGPLRIDTILTLAASKETDLAQSYERRSPFAGRIQDEDLEDFLDIKDRIDPYIAILKLLYEAGGVDWAPILLSRELTHTEYGQLLNITDQMLKGWSLNNDIAYGNFDYRVPLDYPDLTGIMYRIENEIGQPFKRLTFNWNTAGYGSWSEFENYRIFSMHQSGALPISYIPDSDDLEITENVEKAFISAEDDYGEFFADLRDPYLNRVAQYAALHVIFQAYPVVAEREEPIIDHGDYTNRWKIFYNVVANAIYRISTLRDMDPDELVSISEIVGDTYSEGCNLNLDNSLEVWRASAKALVEIAGRYRQNDDIYRLAEALVSTRRLLDELNNERANLIKLDDELSKSIDVFNSKVRQCNSSEVLSSVIDCSSLLSLDREAIENTKSELSERFNRFRQWENNIEQLLIDAQVIKPVVKVFGSCTKAWQAVCQGNFDPELGFFKTPSIVVSSAVNEFSGTGGHNLDGRSLRVIADSKVKPGNLKIDNDGNVLRLNSRDMSKASTVAREFERFRGKYLSGDHAYQIRTQSRLKNALVSDVRGIQRFSMDLIGRADADLNLRAVGSRVDVGRRFVDRQTVLTTEKAETVKRYADSANAHFVVSRDKGSYQIFYPNGHPPFVIDSRSPAQFQRNLEIAVRDAGARKTAEISEVIVVSDGTIGVNELQGLRVSSAARQVVAEANGGGIGLPPRKPPKQGFIFGNSRKRGTEYGGGGGKGGDGGKGGGGKGGGGKGGDKELSQRSLAFFPVSSQTRRVLIRTDVDWLNATVTKASIHTPTKSGGLAVAVLKIPSTSSRPSLIARLTAIFRKRIPNHLDLKSLVDTAKNETASLGPRGTVQEKIEAIRTAYEKAVADDATLRFIIQEGKIDFFVVENNDQADTNYRIIS